MKRNEIFFYWTSAYLHDQGLAPTEDLLLKGMNELLLAYNLQAMPVGSSRQLRARPDSLVFEQVLRATPNEHNTIFVDTDLTMALVEQWRLNVLRVAIYPPPPPRRGPGGIDLPPERPR